MKGLLAYSYLSVRTDGHLLLIGWWSATSASSFLLEIRGTDVLPWLALATTATGRDCFSGGSIWGWFESGGGWLGLVLVSVFLVLLQSSPSHHVTSLEAAPLKDFGQWRLDSTVKWHPPEPLWIVVRRVLRCFPHRLAQLKKTFNGYGLTWTEQFLQYTWGAATKRFPLSRTKTREIHLEHQLTETPRTLGSRAHQLRPIWWRLESEPQLTTLVPHIILLFTL